MKKKFVYVLFETSGEKSFHSLWFKKKDAIAFLKYLGYPNYNKKYDYYHKFTEEVGQCWKIEKNEIQETFYT
jgi:hypothetical protein